jgi:hypothetical protein
VEADFPSERHTGYVLDKESAGEMIQKLFNNYDGSITECLLIALCASQWLIMGTQCTSLLMMHSRTLGLDSEYMILVFFHLNNVPWSYKHCHPTIASKWMEIVVFIEWF